MPRADYRICKACGRHSSVVGPLSHTRLCVSCWNDRRESGIRQLIAHDGPVFQHWRRRLVASAGGVLVDDLHERT